MKLRGFMSFGLSMGVYGVKHRAKNQHANNHTDPHNEHMQVIDVAADLGNTRRHVDLVFSTGQRCQ